MEARMTEVKHEIRFFFFPFQNEIHLKFCFHKPLQILFVQLSGPVYSTWRSPSKAVIHIPPLPGHTTHFQPREPSVNPCSHGDYSETTANYPLLSNTHRNSSSDRRCAGALCHHERFVWRLNGEMPEGDCRVHVGLRHQHHSVFYSDAQWPALNLRPASEKKRQDG